MSSIKLHKVPGEAFTRIVQGKRWIGRVYATPAGYGGRIGQGSSAILVDGYTTEDQAFREVGSRFFGHDSHAALQAQNSAVRHQRRESKARARHAMDQFFAGDDRAFLDLLGKIR